MRQEPQRALTGDSLTANLIGSNDAILFEVSAMPEFPDFPLRATPTPARPLLGNTVLVVEDSRFACDALRLLCQRSGARIRRADCLASGRRHLQVYRPSVVIIDLGLPDGDGTELIEELDAATPRVPVLMATSGDDDKLAGALNAGADGFLAKPIESLAAFQAAILEHIPFEHHPKGPRAIPKDTISPDMLAYKDDIGHAADMLSQHQDPDTLAYLAQFLCGVAETAKDSDLARAAGRLRTAPTQPGDLSHLASLLAERRDVPLAV